MQGLNVTVTTPNAASVSVAPISVAPAVAANVPSVSVPALNVPSFAAVAQSVSEQISTLAPPQRSALASLAESPASLQASIARGVASLASPAIDAPALGVPPSDAAATKPAGLPGPKLGPTGIALSNPKPSFAGVVGAAATQTIEAEKPAVTEAISLNGFIHAGDTFGIAVKLHDAAPQRPGTPRVDASVSYSTLDTAATDAAAKKTHADTAQGVRLSASVTDIGTQQMAAGVDALLKGDGWSAEVKGSFNIESHAISADGVVSVGKLAVTGHYDKAPKSLPNSTIGLQYNIGDDAFVKGEFRDKAGVSSVYVGGGLKFKF
jgi:hypothetical protein